MIRFLDKEREMALLPKLFDLLYENMKEIAPSELDYESEKAHWLSCVTPALSKDPRKIVLIFDGTELICTPNTGHPVLVVFSCGIVTSLS